MRRRDIEALGHKPVTGRKHPVYLDLLPGLRIERPNQGWATAISYIPMARGFVFLAGSSRRVLAHRVSLTTEADSCIQALDEPIARHGPSGVVNTDPGSQSIRSDFIDELGKRDIGLAMDGRGRWRGNVVVERFWHSVKYEKVYVSAARVGIARPTCSTSRRSQNLVEPTRAERGSSELWYHTI